MSVVHPELAHDQQRVKNRPGLADKRSHG